MFEQPIVGLGGDRKEVIGDETGAAWGQGPVGHTNSVWVLLSVQWKAPGKVYSRAGRSWDSWEDCSGCWEEKRLQKVKGRSRETNQLVDWQVRVAEPLLMMDRKWDESERGKSSLTPVVIQAIGWTLMPLTKIKKTVGETSREEKSRIQLWAY